MNKIVNNVEPFTCPGSKVAVSYVNKYDEKQKRYYVVPDKEFDIDEFIQASNSQSDLSLLRQQMIATGQIPTVTDEIVDYSLYPENIHELNRLVNSVDERFNSLPDSIKVVFGNKDKFLAALTSGTYEESIINYYQNVADKSIKVNNDETQIKEKTNE